MACCTTIPPLNSGQKRSSGGIFDLPKSAKRRRPFTSTSITTMSPMPSTTSAMSSPSKFNSPSSNSMFNNNNNTIHTSPKVIIDASDESKRNSSIFQSTTSHFQYDDTDNHQQFQFNTELMQRFKHEAKRLIKKRNQQKVNLATSQANTSSCSSSGTDDETTTPSSTKINKINTSITTTTNNNNNNNNLLSVSSSILSKNASNITSQLTNSPTTITTTTTSKSNLSTISHLKVASNDLHSSAVSKTASFKSHNDMPLFSMNQVNQICAGMIREREQVIREQYDKILADKLSEQYDSFVKFTHEQIQRRFENSQCSYVS